MIRGRIESILASCLSTFNPALARLKDGRTIVYGNMGGEGRLPQELIDELCCAGHKIEVVADYWDMMDHAGAAAEHANGLIEGTTDCRPDGACADYQRRNN